MRKDALSEAELEAALSSVTSPDIRDSDGKRIEWSKLARHLLTEFHVITLSGVKRELFIHKDGVYINETSCGDAIKKRIHELAGKEANVALVKQVIEAIKDLTSIDRDSIRDDATLINLHNGIFDLRKWCLVPHTPEVIFFSKVPITYSPEADCPQIKQFLSEVLSPDMVPVVQELFGYVLYRSYFIKKAFIFVGEGDTGKSTLLSLLCAFLGESNVSGISLHRLVSDRFAGGTLYQKMANIYDDLSAKDIHDNGPFKIVTGGGVLSGEKKFMDHFMFKNFAKLIFACNKIPDIKQADDDAYFLRWIVIPFSRIIEEDKKDRQLLQRMTTDKELSGLLNYALEGLQRLLSKQRFSYEKTTAEIKDEMMRSASTIARFASEMLLEASGEWLTKDDMYHEYTSYCSRMKIPAASKQTFGSRLRFSAPYIAEGRPKDPTGAKVQVTAWRNVKFKERDSETTEDDPGDLFGEI